MATIEERALNATMNCVVSSAPYYVGYMDGATEQDPIARAEERERCIKAAQDAYCFNHCKGYCTMYAACKHCNEREEIRNAIEKRD